MRADPAWFDFGVSVVHLKAAQRPEKKVFVGKPHDSLNGTRRRTRPWDNCWFSNKPQYIQLTVEEVFKINPSYILWCYDNLTSIKWSVHTMKMINKY
jgi:hypothetical protein